MIWKKYAENFMEKMFGPKWKKLIQKKWEKLEWTEKEDNDFRRWALQYLKKKGVCKSIAEKETGWFMLKYAPKLKTGKCKTCYGYGLWAIGNPAPMGTLDAQDGFPTKKCPECKANENPYKYKRSR